MDGVCVFFCALWLRLYCMNVLEIQLVRCGVVSSSQSNCGDWWVRMSLCCRGNFQQFQHWCGSNNVGDFVIDACVHGKFCDSQCYLS